LPGGTLLRMFHPVMTPPVAGYSGTPLAKKLGLTAAQRVITRRAPPDYETLLRPVPTGVRFTTKAAPGAGFVHLFATKRTDLKSDLTAFRKLLAPDGTLWVSWPKKSAKVPTDITEDTIRSLALPLGFVDVKVCAVSEIWSGLKLVIRKELR
jgi:hypothetical protein